MYAFIRILFAGLIVTIPLVIIVISLIKNNFKKGKILSSKIIIILLIVAILLFFEIYKISLNYPIIENQIGFDTREDLFYYVNSYSQYKIVDVIEGEKFDILIIEDVGLFKNDSYPTYYGVLKDGEKYKILSEKYPSQEFKLQKKREFIQVVRYVNNSALVRITFTDDFSGTVEDSNNGKYVRIEYNVGPVTVIEYVGLIDNFTYDIVLTVGETQYTLDDFIAS